MVYEFDPADVLYSHLYPAVARTFRKEGFQWITQFAYDPIDLAPYNTEYPTHYLNLVYTPAKALSMMVAAEAAREIPRGADYGTFVKSAQTNSMHFWNCICICTKPKFPKIRNIWKQLGKQLQRTETITFLSRKKTVGWFLRVSVSLFRI